MPGYDPQQTYRDAVNRNLMINDWHAQRMLNGGGPPESGGCLSSLFALFLVVMAFSIVSSIVIYGVHIGEHIVHFFQ